MGTDQVTFGCNLVCRAMLLSHPLRWVHR